MPFVQRTVEPKYLSRTSLQNENGKALVSDCELQAVTNNTLSNALRQLASLVLVANDIFNELTKELQCVSERSKSLKVKIEFVEEKIAGYDPKIVPVPEGDISTFALLRTHYEQKQPLDSGLFNASTRPSALRALYEAAARTPVHAMRQMDRWRRDGHRSSRFFLCTPVLGEKRRRIRTKVDIDIETRMPAVVGELRRWTSAEAIGDITVTPDCVNRITSNTTTAEDSRDIIDSGDDEAIDHKLPSPEEQLQVLALKFPAEIVPVDVSGRRFDRMSIQRRSLLHSEATCEDDAADGTVRRRTRSRKPRGKRRNTLAGTDQKEIQDALTAGDATTTTSLDEPLNSPECGPVLRSRSTDILRSKKSSSSPTENNKKSHFNTLKQWGKSRLKLINKSLDLKSNESKISDDIDDINIYETVSMRRRRNIDKEKDKNDRKPSYSSSEKSSSISLPISTPLSAAMNIAVKLRESSAQRRHRRNNKDDQHSSSGNWSASSESGRASIGSEITSTATTIPKSSTSAATSSNSLNHGPPSSVNSRRRFNNTSTSSSVTSEGTLTPDIIQDIQDDGETSSVYSCDTEGYYTSFHMDSGLKTLREEELGLPMTPLHTTSAFSNGNCTFLTAENEYELFGKGSTSTTTSSAGTVCTTLRAAESNRSLMVGPVVPERKSSLNEKSENSSLERDFSSEKTGTVKRSPAGTKSTVIAMVHKPSSNGDISPDSGHNTSSSPIESVSSPNGAPSCSEFEFSESSDLEGVERIERIRIKTTINSSRIPSMCVITPPQSDDESVKSVERKSKFSSKDTRNNLNIPELGSKNANRPKLNLNLQPTETDLDSLNSNKMQVIHVNPSSGYATIETIDSKSVTPKSVRAPSPSGGVLIVKNESKSTSPSQPILKATLLPLNNMFGRLKTNLSNLTTSKKEKTSPKPLRNVENLFDSGDYVTIADVRNNNEKISMEKPEEVIYANEVLKKPERIETEYISLTDLPDNQSTTNSAQNSLERNRRHGARVTLDSEGKVVYSSDSLKRRKGAHTTFEPGPFVKDPTTTPLASPLPTHRTPKAIRPVPTQEKNSRPLSPQLNKFVIRAGGNNKPSSGDCVRMAPSTIVRATSPKAPGPRGAYVHMQEPPAHQTTEERALSPSRFTDVPPMHPQTLDRYYQRQQPVDFYQNHADIMQRSSPLYRTLPSRNTPPHTHEARAKIPEHANASRQSSNYQFSSLPRRQMAAVETANFPQYSQMQFYSNQVPFNSEFSNNQVQSCYYSSPIETQSNISSKNNESLRISPIDPRNFGSFQSSTPSKLPESNTVANLSNKLLSPKKSTMSNEELYAMIHKSKKKLNIKTTDDIDSPVSLSPAGSVRALSGRSTPTKQPESGYFNETKNRNSWSPNIDTNIPAFETNSKCSDRLGVKQTSRLDFKKLLLQHGSKSNIIPASNTKLSAVEQLKLTKSNSPNMKSNSPMNILDLSSSPRSLVNRKLGNIAPSSPEKQRPPVKLLSPRSNWKFSNPRSDVLSSTILEDCGEDETSNSSNERSKLQNSIARSNILNSTANSFKPKPNRAEILQAQRAEFFKNPGIVGSSGANRRTPSPPTLETAL